MNGPRTEAGKRQQQHHVGVIVGKAAMFLLFGMAAGVSDADVRDYDDVRRARVSGRIVEINRERRAVEDLPQPDTSRRAIVLEDFYSRVSIRRTLQPEKRNVIFRRPDAGAVGGFRVGNKARIGKQGRG